MADAFALIGLREAMEATGVRREDGKWKGEYELDDGTKIKGETDEKGNGKIRIENGNDFVVVNRSDNSVTVDGKVTKDGKNYEIHVKGDGSWTVLVNDGQGNQIEVGKDRLKGGARIGDGDLTLTIGRDGSVTITGKESKTGTSGSIAIDRSGKGKATIQGELGDNLRGGISIGQEGIGFRRGGKGLHIGSKPPNVPSVGIGVESILPPRFPILGGKPIGIQGYIPLEGRGIGAGIYILW